MSKLSRLNCRFEPPVADVGQMLRLHRLTAGLTQETLAVMLSVRSDRISRIEHGVNNPRATFYLAWIAACEHG